MKEGEIDQTGQSDNDQDDVSLSSVASDDSSIVIVKIKPSEQRKRSKTAGPYYSDCREKRRKLDKGFNDGHETAFESSSSSTSNIVTPEGKSRKGKMSKELISVKKGSDDVKPPASVNIVPYLYAQVAKYFDETIYYGRVTDCFSVESEMAEDDHSPMWCWHVRFEDGDEEDWDLEELKEGLDAFKSRPRRKCKFPVSSTHSMRKGDKPVERLSISSASEIEEYHDVAQVLGRRTKKMRGGFESVEYLVQWKNSWVGAESLGAEILAKAFRKFDVEKPENNGESTDSIEMSDENESAAEKTENIEGSNISINENESQVEKPEINKKRSINAEISDENDTYPQSTSESDDESESNAQVSTKDGINVLSEHEYESKPGEYLSSKVMFSCIFLFNRTSTNF